MKKLTIRFEQYDPPFSPHLYDLIPKRRWADLKEVFRESVVFHEYDLSEFVSRHRETVQKMHMYCPKKF